VSDDLRSLAWIGNSPKELRAFPEDVKDVMAYALHLAQAGSKRYTAKPLARCGGAGVLQVVDDHDGDTYRAVYTVKFVGRVDVLHAFQLLHTRSGRANTAGHALNFPRSRQLSIDRPRKPTLACSPQGGPPGTS
jgi:phage-related protein